MEIPRPPGSDTLLVDPKLEVALVVAERPILGASTDEQTPHLSVRLPVDEDHGDQHLRHRDDIVRNIGIDSEPKGFDS